MTRRVYPPLFPGQTHILHGGDYNPEQWPEEIWHEDSRLMKVTHVNSVTVGVFSWVSLEPEEGRFTFEWMDKVLDLQAESGRKVALATPTAAVPAWMSRKYPEILKTGPDRVRRLHGNRVNTCWTSPEFKAKVTEIDWQLANRYKNHPALAMWHISNEFGGACYCKLCEAKFQEWLQEKYGSLDALNAAYWSAFWGHTYTAWEQIEIPGDPYGETSIHALTVDFKRFTSHQIAEMYRHEAKTLRAITPDVPCTTNLMGTYNVLNPHDLAADLDFASWDSYPWFGGEPYELSAWTQCSFTHDLNRSIKGGRPFLLMECSPSASNWYPTMGMKRPGMHELEGLQAVAHGADGVEYFQWRQSRGSMEQFHGAVVAHNNREDAKVFQDVKALGETLKGLGGLVGGSVPAEVALVYDWDVAWGVDVGLGYRSKRPNYNRTVVHHYRPLFEANVEVDIVESIGDLSRYKLVIAPMLYLVRPGAAENLAKFVENGGTLVTTYWSFTVDENSLAYVGGYPEPLKSMLGIWSEEVDELYPDRPNGVLWNGEEYGATDYCERIHTDGAEVLATYAGEYYAGQPALTRNRYGKGQAYFVASRNDASFTKALMSKLLAETGVEPGVKVTATPGLSVRRREAADADFVFVLNYADAPGKVSFDASELAQGELVDTLSGKRFTGEMELPAFGSAVLVRHRVGVLS